MGLGVGGYFWNAGYWGRHIGYYGGINYGFGYFGTGFYGGYWNGGHFFYNGAYNHIGFHNGFVYNHPVAGFDGRPGGAAFARGGATVATNRGAGVNGNNFANRGGNVRESWWKHLCGTAAAPAQPVQPITPERREALPAATPMLSLAATLVRLRS